MTKSASPLSQIMSGLEAQTIEIATLRRVFEAHFKGIARRPIEVATQARTRRKSQRVLVIRTPPVLALVTHCR